MPASLQSGSQLLVSFANSDSTVDELLAQGRSHLALIDLYDSRLTWIRLPSDAGSHQHVTGLAQNDEFVFCTCLGSTAVIAVYRKPELDLHSVSVLPTVNIHDILYHDGYLNAVATAEDRVYRFRVNGGHVDPHGELIWSVPGSDGASDTHHLNCLGLVDGGLVVSGFGPKSGLTWSTAGGGYLWNIATGESVREGIYHPHTVFNDGNGVLFCESTRGALRHVGGGAIVIESGYTRGIARLDDGSLALGVSARRTVSKSTGITNRSGDSGLQTQRCGILVIGPGWPDDGPTEGRHKCWLDLLRFQHEVYQILALGGVITPTQESIVGQNEVHCVEPSFAVTELDALPDLLVEEELLMQQHGERVERLYKLTTSERALLQTYRNDLLAKEAVIVELKAAADQRLELVESSHTAQRELIAEVESKDRTIHEVDAARQELESIAAERLALILEQCEAIDHLMNVLLASNRSLAEKEAVIAELKAAAQQRLELIEVGQAAQLELVAQLQAHEAGSVDRVTTDEPTQG